MNDPIVLIITPVVTSIIAAFIFWIIFNYIPEKSRYNKIRPKLEYDIYEIYSSLFHFIEIPFRFNHHSPAYNQHEIFAGLKSAEDFELALYSKCLNDSYKTINTMSSKLISIGSRLDSISLKICDRTQQLYVFNHYLSVDEILLFRKITAKIRTYSYNDTAEIKIGNQTFYPANPTISYMSNNFYELFLLFLQLQEIVLHYNKIDNSIKDTAITNLSRREITNYYYRGEYKECLRLIKKYKKDDDLWGFKFRSLYNIEKKDDAIKYLKLHLPTTHLKLISLRSTFLDFYNEKEIKNILINSRSKTEYIEMLNCIESEQIHAEQMISQAISFKEYYKAKPI